MENAREDMIVLHPMPIVNEITGAVDEDTRACSSVPAQYGMCVRMALILSLLGGGGGDSLPCAVRKCLKRPV